MNADRTRRSGIAAPSNFVLNKSNWWLELGGALHEAPGDKPRPPLPDHLLRHA